MWFNKSLTVATLLAIGVTMPAIVQAETTVTTETRDYDPKENSGKPADPKFVCSVRDHTCRAADNFTGIPLKGNVQLSTCSEDKPVWSVLSWTFNGFRFYNTFWASCQDKDKDCEKYVTDHMSDLHKVAQDLRQSVKEQTNCNPTFRCYKLEDADERCFQK